MAKAGNLTFGIQECSKCQYKVRCEECVYNTKDIQQRMRETRKETAEKFAEKLKEKCKMDNPLELNVFLINEKTIDEICKEITEGK